MRGVADRNFSENPAAACGQHCAEVHAPCCYPCLLADKLRAWPRWDVENFPMFTQHYIQGWRACLSYCMESSTEDAPEDRAHPEFLQREAYNGGDPLLAEIVAGGADRSEARPSAPCGGPFEHLHESTTKSRVQSPNGFAPS